MNTTAITVSDIPHLSTEHPTPPIPSADVAHPSTSPLPSGEGPGVGLSDLRTYFAHATLPAELHPRPYMHITDVPAFVALHLARLDSDSPLLRRLAEKNLRALLRLLDSQP